MTRVYSISALSPRVFDSLYILRATNWMIETRLRLRGLSSWPRIESGRSRKERNKLVNKKYIYSKNTREKDDYDSEWRAVRNDNEQNNDIEKRARYNSRKRWRCCYSEYRGVFDRHSNRISRDDPPGIGLRDRELKYQKTIKERIRTDAHVPFPPPRGDSRATLPCQPNDDMQRLTGLRLLKRYQLSVFFDILYTW